MTPKEESSQSDSNIIITGGLNFWGNYFLPTPVSLWRSDLRPMGVSDHCYTRSDDLLTIGVTGSMSSFLAELHTRWRSGRELMTPRSRLRSLNGQ